MTETHVTYAEFLKEFYVGTVVADLVYKNHPWLGIVPKNPEVRGSVYPKPIRYSNITGQSSLFSKAHANQGNPARERWDMTHIDNYAKATISNKVMELSLGNPAAFREALTDVVDSAYSAFGNDVHFELLAKYANGARGASAGAISGSTVTLGAGEARFFEVGMVVQHTDALDHDTIIAEEQTVTAVDRQADTIDLDADFTTDPLAAGDRLYRSGDHAAKAASLPLWVPGTSATATAWFGVDRSEDTRLAGITPTKGTGSTPYLNALVLCGAELYREGTSPDIALVNPIDQAKLAEETEQRGRYAKVSSTSGSISFSALEVMTGSGAVPVIAEPALAEDSLLMGERGAVELFSAGGLPRMFKKDGSFYHREETADNIAFYLFGFYNQVVQAPIKWAYSSDWA
jgi:hypothetical protein